MLNKVDMVAVINAWLVDSGSELSGRDFAVELTESPSGRDPASVWLLLESAEKIVELIAWTNGMVEVKSANVASGEIASTSRELENISQFVNVVRDLVELLR